MQLFDVLKPVEVGRDSTAVFILAHRSYRRCNFNRGAWQSIIYIYGMQSMRSIYEKASLDEILKKLKMAVSAGGGAGGGGEPGAGSSSSNAGTSDNPFSKFMNEV